MGRKYDDPEVQRTLKSVPYKITSAPNGDVRVTMGGREYSPPEISAMILQKLKADAKATTIPTRKSEIFSTAADNQPAVEIHVLQGERELAKDNKSLGHFHL